MGAYFYGIRLMATVVVSEKESQLTGKYDQATLVRDWLRMIHDQVVLLRLGLTTDQGKQTLVGGIDVLQLLLMDFWDSAATDIEQAAQELKDNGFGKYLGEEK